jgi:hypothetical protein
MMPSLQAVAIRLPGAPASRPWSRLQLAGKCAPVHYYPIEASIHRGAPFSALSSWYLEAEYASFVHSVRPRAQDIIPLTLRESKRDRKRQLADGQLWTIGMYAPPKWVCILEKGSGGVIGTDLDVLTVSPNTRKRGILRPMTPDCGWSLV